MPPTACENMHLIEGIIVQALAFARDSVAAIGSRHEEKRLQYEKKVDVRIAPAESGTRMTITWNSGQLPPADEMTDFSKHPGLFTASSIIAGMEAAGTYRLGAHRRFPMIRFHRGVERGPDCTDFSQFALRGRR